MEQLKNYQYVIWDPDIRTSHLPFLCNSENSYFIPLKFVPQNGPNCGFAALCMIASSFGLDLKPDVLVEKAKLRNITNHGEMFSTEEMALFAQEILSLHADVILKNYSIKGCHSEFKNQLLNNNLILIPYDCDFNHEPCLKKGASAHWAIVCGFVDGGCQNDFFVLACHGKTQFVSPWKFDDLRSSNENLIDLGDKRRSDENCYVIPVGGLEKGLASKWILFSRKLI